MGSGKRMTDEEFNLARQGFREFGNPHLTRFVAEAARARSEESRLQAELYARNKEWRDLTAENAFLAAENAELVEARKALELIAKGRWNIGADESRTAVEFAKFALSRIHSGGGR